MFFCSVCMKSWHAPIAQSAYMTHLICGTERATYHRTSDLSRDSISFPGSSSNLRVPFARPSRPVLAIGRGSKLRSGILFSRFMPLNLVGCRTTIYAEYESRYFTAVQPGYQDEKEFRVGCVLVLYFYFFRNN